MGGPGEAAPGVDWSQGGEKGLLPGRNFTSFAPPTVAFPHPPRVPAEAPGGAAQRAGPTIAGEERVDTTRPHVPGEAVGMRPLDPGLSLAWGSVGSLAALFQPCYLQLCAAAQPGPLPRSSSASAELPGPRRALNCCPGWGEGRSEARSMFFLRPRRVKPIGHGLTWGHKRAEAGLQRWQQGSAPASGSGVCLPQG